MKESDLISAFTKWSRSNWKDGHCNIEFKLVKGKSLAFSDIRDNQYQGLIDMTSTGIPWKHSDMDIRLKMCDWSWLQGPSYLGVCFYESRKEKKVHLIAIDNFLEYVKNTQRKSITMNEVKRISSKIIVL